MASSRQSNTIRTYISAYRQYEKWASGIEELSVYPANDLAVTIYVLSLVQKGKKINSIQQFLFAAAWLHSIGGYVNPTNSTMVKTVLEGAKRVAKNTVTRKEPINTRIIKKIKKHMLGKKKCLDLTGARMMAYLLLGYAGFMRVQETLKLKRSDIAFHSSYMSIFIEQSKTDKYREGQTLLIARSAGSLDPVRHVYQYLKAARIPDNSHKYIFRAITVGNGKQYLRSTNKSITYSTIRDLFLQQIANVGLDPKKFGTHSLRAGGATAAANRGLPDRIFKAHGRWRSEDSKDRYIKDSIHNKLKVTLNLGL